MAARSVVSGGAGFLGSHLCEALLARGDDVICLDNLETGSLDNISHLEGERFEFRNVDITEHVEIEQEIDFVFHLASPASPIDYLRLPLQTLKVGAEGTRNMLGLAKRLKADGVHLGHQAVVASARWAASTVARRARRWSL